MSELIRLEPVQQCAVQILFLRGQDELEIVRSTHPSDIGLTLGVNYSVSGRAIQERKTIIIGDVSQDMHYLRLLGESIRSEITVPILFGDDDMAIGVLNIESEEAQAFNESCQLLLEDFARKVSTLLAFTKMLTDVTEAVEVRTTDDLLVAVGDQTGHIFHRLNNTVGAMRFRILELQEMRKDGRLNGDDFLDESLQALRTLAERTLKMPGEFNPLGQGETDVDVNQCVRDAISSIHLPPNVQLQVELDEEIPALPLYSFDIVVQNLLQNGVDAMPAGGLLSVMTSMVIDYSLRKGYFQLKVQDTGQGIPVEIQRRLFELNFTTKREKGRGPGVGLWWVRQFVRRAKGDITIQSTPGSGTEVTVKIPVKHVEEYEPYYRLMNS
jgi:signal transduction histidine kinase